ncbi:MAG: hypothetical protein PHV23_04410 [Candidatus Gracilibacteria bacterium]|nr:hypothetical protein [Candidatus Gracilibacteria bacterium]
MRRFELETIFVDAIVFTNREGNFEIIGDYSIISESSEELDYWLHQLALKDLTDISVSEMKGFIDSSKSRYDVILRISHYLYIFISKERKEDSINESEALRIKILASDVAEIMLAQYV